ncbi:MAG: acetyl esterase/lipase [Bacteroidia bacterium]|jgi:acetyl esterase/lipase
MKLRRFTFSTVFLLAIVSQSFGQNYIDTLYQIKTDKDISYGSATDVAGNVRDLKMDISYPTNDSVKPCGRPVMIIIHGGSFMAGDKGDGSLTTLREEFAKRGYVTASVNYRLGMFQTDRSINCNVSTLWASWNCLNMTDSSEWYRAYYRGIQDVHGAIRYIVNNRNEHKPNPNNVFVVGESAGGFIAMGVGFMDDTTEVMQGLTAKMANVKPPNKIYENACIIGQGLDTFIASMLLTRPALGDYWGNLNPPLQNSYTIRGVGNFYGGVFQDIFESHSSVTPVLYTYHQPNDLLVPIGKNRIFAGLNACAMGLPFNCQGITNRPMMYGSQAIINLIDTAKEDGKRVPKYQFDKTTNNANCATQIANPSTTGHAFDNFTLRRSNMAKIFAEAIDTCQTNGVRLIQKHLAISIFPNPNHGSSGVTLVGFLPESSAVQLCDLNGNILQQWEIAKTQHKSVLHWDQSRLAEGIYIIRISDGNQTINKRIIVLN